MYVTDVARYARRWFVQVILDRRARHSLRHRQRELGIGIEFQNPGASARKQTRGLCFTIEKKRIVQSSKIIGPLNNREAAPGDVSDVARVGHPLLKLASLCRSFPAGKLPPFNVEI